MLSCLMGLCILSQAEHWGCLQDTWLSLERIDCHCLAVHYFLYLCSQLTVLPILSAPAQTFPVLPAPSWSHLHHHMRTGRSIAGKRAQGRPGLMAPAQQQKVGKVFCLGGSSARRAPRSPAGACQVPGLGALLIQASLCLGRKEQPAPLDLPLISHLQWKQDCHHAHDCIYY